VLECLGKCTDSASHQSIAPALQVFIPIYPLANGGAGGFNLPVPQQQTLNRAAGFAGIGLHSGNRVNMKFLPAPANSGIRFRRVDLEGKPEIEARVDNVSETTRSTTLARGNIKVQTVEHVLAAFAGCGVDNAVVELDANEPPIADGSAREYVRLIEEAGIAAQPESRETYTVTAPIELKQGETVMSLFPHDAFKITCTSADKQGRFTQFFSIEVSPEVWKRELAHARTFCFYEEIEHLIKNGLIKGGSLENAVVIREDAVLTTEPLRYPEEFVRHKILDIVGDLSLVGRPLNGHVIAVKPSHSANCELARQIVAQMNRPLRAMQTFAPPPAGEKTEAAATGKAAEDTLMDINEIMRLLPHRYPFLMVDKVIKIEENRIVGVKNVTINEPFFQGHFPGHPIMPGVLQLEAIAQVAGILTMKRAETVNSVAYFMSAENVKWRKPVLPGDTLVIDVELTKIRGKIGKAKGVCKVGNDVVSEADVTFMIMQA
jgi:UDP-3-O-[3-hydroxymyristoyl] N-acetylglucosamine deacetylase / 3-hydroxyacyl-[acyl-carrier-protein] dehydratase